MGLMVAFGIAEAISIVTVLQSVAAVGAVLGVVGKVTGDKTLSMVGLGLGIVGGIGSLAAGALGFGAAAADATGAMVPAAAGGAIGGEAGAANAVIDMGGSAAAPDIIGSLGGEAAAVDMPAFNNIDFGSSQTLAMQSDPVTTGATSGTTADASSTTSDITGTAGHASGSSASPGVADVMGKNPVNINAMPGGAGFAPPKDELTSFSDVFDSLKKFAKDNPTIAYGALQAGGSLLSGMTSTLTPAQVALANSQAEQAKASASLLTQQTANLAQPKPTASLPAVTGTPAPLLTNYTPPPTGLINSVTGRV